MKRYYIEFEIADCPDLNRAKWHLNQMVQDGELPVKARVIEADDTTKALMGAIEDTGAVGPESDMLLKLIDRLLADDWTGSGVYEALDAALTTAEQAQQLDAVSQGFEDHKSGE